MNEATGQLSLLAGFVLGTVAAGYFAYQAWFRPDLHQEFLNTWGGAFRRWPLGVERVWKSRATFWVTRISYTLAFVISLVAVGAQVLHLVAILNAR